MIRRLIGVNLSIGYLEKHVFKRHFLGKYQGLPWHGAGMDSLVNLCLRSLSVYNKMFTGDRYGRFVVQSTENLYPHKLVHLMEKFDKPTRDPKVPTPYFSSILFKGLRSMYKYMGVEKHFRRLWWEFSPLDVTEMQSVKQAAAGIRPGQEHRSKVDGITYVVTPNGTKEDQEYATKKKILEYMEEFRKTGKFDFVDKACCICLKQEVFFNDSIDPKKRAEFYLKCREFFIMNFRQYMIAYLVLKDRQMFERGKMIKVGLRWLFGGAHYFADQLQYADPDMRYFDGDFKALDTTLNRVFLELYVSQAAVYVDKSSVDYPMFLYLLQLATENLSVKAVHIFARVWKLIIGVMPSGAFETSHGNSWIVGLLFFTYIESIKVKYPYKAQLINDKMNEGKIQFPVYGDDHVIGVHKSLSDIINEEGFAKFVNDYCDMEISKIRSNIPFCSTLDDYGNFSEAGVVFLKKYFVERDRYDFPKYLPEILPCKKFEDCLVKFAYGNRSRLTLVDYALACIGMAYDNMGINPYIHEFCENLFRYCVQVADIKNMDVLKEAYLQSDFFNQRDFTRTLRKIGIPVEQLLKGFPTRRQLIDMHIYDSEYVDFTPPFKRYNPREYVDWSKLYL